MNTKKLYLIFNIAIWTPWGLACTLAPFLITEIIGVKSINPSGETDMRAMYGGFQLAMGLMAIHAFYNPRFFKSFVYALGVIGSCLALSRTYGLFMDSSFTAYTFGVLGYEAFAGISGLLWLGKLSDQASDHNKSPAS
ncbi:DUF4345 family protein [Endozoicomonas sp.]|uniref:DUF4345 family protein n=1 Tax=Endozoicomonas sp. TaxID=1892382 RepID=UPI002885F179|nr:DUF4345 family protein [Endozoicomonas sp.]